MSKRAVIYARVSTDMQRDNYSIPTQIADCIRHAENRRYTLLGNQYVDIQNGLDVKGPGPNTIPAYVDDFTSRELSRPSLDAAFEFLDTYGFDILIVHAIDRLARDPYIRQTLEREFNSRGARVEYVLGSYDETPEGEVRKDLDATFAKWENAKRTERCNRGRKRKAESGKFVAGRVPYGYRINPSVFGGLEVVPEEAEVIRRIFHLYVEERASIRQIVRELDATGCTPYRQADKWAKSTVNRILDNTTYVGYFYYNKNKRLDRKRFEARPRHEWIRVECEPLISQEQFDAAQLIKEENKVRVRRQPRRFYMLTGMIICDECERPYVSQTDTPDTKPGLDRRKHRKTEQQLYRHRLRAGHCMNHQVSANLIEKIVWDKVLDILMDPDALVVGYQQALEQQMAVYKKKRALIDTLEQNLHKNKVKRQKLNAAYLDPDIEMSKHEFLEQKSTLDDEAKIIEEDLATKRREMDHIPVPADVETLKKFALEIVRGIQPVEKLTRQRKREILQMMHVTARICLSGDVRLDGWFTPKSDNSKDGNPSSNENNGQNGGFSSHSSAGYALQRQPLPERVWLVPAL